MAMGRDYDAFGIWSEIAGNMCVIGFFVLQFENSDT